MKTLIKNYDNAIPAEICKEIIKIGNSNENFLKKRHEESEYNSESSLVYQDLSMGIASLLNPIQLSILQNSLSKCFNLYLDEFPILKPGIPQGVYFNDCKFQKTEPTEGFHQWHCEHLPVFPFSLRFAVWTLYLNDIEEGGETEFLYQSTRIKPKQGSINLFPAYYTHTHRGNPPLNKTKYILTGWVEHSQILNSDIINPELIHKQ
jgi:hypothetical protein